MKCKNCGAEMQQRQHKYLKPKMLKQPYFFLRWYKCPGCKKQYNFEEDKCFNMTKHYQPEIKQKTQVEEYYDELTSHLNSIKHAD